MSDLEFAPLVPRDLAEIRRQPRQRTFLGMDGAVSDEDAEVLASEAVAWSCRADGRLIACFGIAEQFPGRQGLGWTLLADGLGAAHLQLTRFVQAQIAGCGLPRLEVLARAPDLESLLADRDLDSGQIVQLAMADPTPEMRWAVMLGLTPAHLLRCYGAASESYMLFERISPTCAKSQTDPSCLSHLEVAN